MFLEDEQEPVLGRKKLKAEHKQVKAGHEKVKGRDMIPGGSHVKPLIKSTTASQKC